MREAPPVNSFKQCLHCTLPPPFDLVPFVNSGTIMITWSHSGPLDGGILCLMAIYGSWGGCWAFPDPPGPASVFARSIRRSIRKSANYTRIIPVGSSQTGAVYILGPANLLLKQHTSKQGHKKGHAFRPGHHASHICHRAYCGFANNRFQLSGYEHANENEQCYEAHAYLVPALGLKL